MNHFFAYLDRLKLIRRWGLMRNTMPENDMEHSMQTALIAHGLAVLGKTRHQRDIDPEHVLALALYHDVGEVITGGLSNIKTPPFKARTVILRPPRGSSCWTCFPRICGKASGLMYNPTSRRTNGASSRRPTGSART